ncbi:hypothetical protein [Methylorubrum populi]|uniref:hypothetical protein n=1 Tax=Methylorubrum populi TaxID=223967 RepID=UPI001264C577|nr:hypothetical protein [Methylorubrum populi]
MRYTLLIILLVLEAPKTLLMPGFRDFEASSSDIVGSIGDKGFELTEDFSARQVRRSDESPDRNTSTILVEWGAVLSKSVKVWLSA